MNHIEKWQAVCEELKTNHPTSNATVWVTGYVFGLTHAATVSRSESGADNAKPPCTPSLQTPNRAEDNR